MSEKDNVYDMGWNDRPYDGDQTRARTYRPAPVATIRIGTLLCAALWVWTVVRLGGILHAQNSSIVDDISTHALVVGVVFIIWTIFAMVAAAAAFIIFQLYRGRDWALWLVIALNVLDIVMMAEAIVSGGAGAYRWNNEAIGYNALRLSALAMLLVPPSLGWFRRQSSPAIAAKAAASPSSPES